MGKTLLPDCQEALAAARSLLDEAKASVAAKVEANGLEAEQLAAHGLAWYATTIEGLTQMLRWAWGLQESGALGELEQLMLGAAFGEYLNQLAGGVPMSQVELVRPADLGLDELPHAFSAPVVGRLRREGRNPAALKRIGELIEAGEHFGHDHLEDDTLPLIRDQFRRFADEQVAPHAHDWHLSDSLIPLSVVEQMAELGVFGLTIPEEHGGL
ncbi:MAG TPA: acyl-CoA dehydrogenase family protein, partial [Magnetospirillaceae bacterium]|nr:acyl-CoA dehydrogenase family protein [Magnetospirillaceae bacterium]